MIKPRNGKNGGRDLSNWMRLILEVSLLVGSILLGYAALDRRLAVIETKMDLALAAQSTFMTKAEVQVLLQGAAETHAALQRQIDDLKDRGGRNGR